MHQNELSRFSSYRYRATLHVFTTPTLLVSQGIYEVRAVLNHSDSRKVADFTSCQVAREREPGEGQGFSRDGPGIWLDIVSLLFILVVVCALLMLQ